MSKLQDLIRELCPEGVEFKKLGEVGEFVRGNGLQKKDFTESGVGCIHYGQIYTYYGTFTETTKSYVSPQLAQKLLQVYPGNLVIACTSENVEDVGKAVAWLGDSTIVTGGHSVVFRHHLNPKYVAYFFQTEAFFSQKKKYAFGAKVIDIKTVDLAKIEIPVPPLPVQEEIVRILDRFAEYAAELQAELQARKEQYEYYRNLLLSFHPTISESGVDEDVKNNVTTWGGA
jgi:type I restriction enzyme S subunit